MIKDKIFLSTLYQTAKITMIETTYDSKYNRPTSVEVSLIVPCRISRKSSSFLFAGQGNLVTNTQMRCYLEVDVNIKKGAVIEVDGQKYNAGLVYKPNNHHTEVDISIYEEA